MNGFFFQCLIYLILQNVLPFLHSIRTIGLMYITAAALTYDSLLYQPLTIQHQYIIIVKVYIYIF